MVGHWVRYVRHVALAIQESILVSCMPLSTLSFTLLHKHLWSSLTRLLFSRSAVFNSCSLTLSVALTSQRTTNRLWFANVTCRIILYFLAQVLNDKALQSFWHNSNAWSSKSFVIYGWLHRVKLYIGINVPPSQCLSALFSYIRLCIYAWKKPDNVSNSRLCRAEHSGHRWNARTVKTADTSGLPVYCMRYAHVYTKATVPYSWWRATTISSPSMTVTRGT